MTLAARILLGVLGLVAAVYAWAGLAGFVTPPWWEHELTEHDRACIASLGPNDSVYEHSLAENRRLPNREAISIGVGTVGLAAFAVAARPRRGAFRLAVGALGLAVGVYGVASLAGLITPSWREVLVRYIVTLKPTSPYWPGEDGRGHQEILVLEPRPGREAITVGMGVFGLAACAFAAWPRRRKTRLPTEPIPPAVQPSSGTSP